MAGSFDDVLDVRPAQAGRTQDDASSIEMEQRLRGKDRE
jgi:hypothetical protein